MNNFFKSFLKLNGYDINTAQTKLRRIYEMNSDEFWDYRNEKKWDIAKWHYKNNAFYRSKVGKYPPLACFNLYSAAFISIFCALIVL